MQKNQKPIVTLKTTRFLPQRDSEGKSIDEVINVKIEHNTLEWSNYLKNIRHLGFVKPSGKVEVIGATILNDKKERVSAEDDVVSAIKAEVLKATQDPDKELTPEQKRIAELEAKIELLMRGKEDDSEKSKDIDPALADARHRYMEVAGKKGSPKWDVETINERIKELEAK